MARLTILLNNLPEKTLKIDSDYPCTIGQPNKSVDLITQMLQPIEAIYLFRAEVRCSVDLYLLISVKSKRRWESLSGI